MACVAFVSRTKPRKINKQILPKPFVLILWLNHGPSWDAGPVANQVRPSPYKEEKSEPVVLGTVSALIKTPWEFGDLHVEKKPSVCWICSETGVSGVISVAHCSREAFPVSWEPLHQ